MAKRKVTHKKISRRGGKSTLKKYGKIHFSEMGKKGNKTILIKYGKEYYKNLSKLAVKARKKKAKMRLTTRPLV